MLFKKLKRRILGGGDNQVDVTLKFLGRENTGKTAILMGLELLVLQMVLDSGLCLDVLDGSGAATSALALNGRMKRLRKRLFDISPQGDGIVTTLEAEPISYALTDGGVPRIRLNTSEEVGQLIGGVDEQSSEDDKQRLRQFHEGVAKSDVVAIVLSPPTRDSDPATCSRWQMDKKQYAVHLQDAVRGGNRRTPLNVALVINKIDTLCPSEQAAREQMTDDVLCDEVQDLINVLHRNELVQHAALFPVSAFGFGKSEVKAKPLDEAQMKGQGPALWQRSARSEEDAYGLRVGQTVEPFNIKTLLLWSLLVSAMNQEVSWMDGEEVPLATVCSKLLSDLHDSGGWYVQLKGELY